MRLRLIILSTMLVFLFFASATPQQEDVVIDNEGEEEPLTDEEEGKVYKKAVEEVRALLSKETNMDKEKRIITVYACVLMIRTHLSKSVEKLRAMVQSYKERAGAIYSKIMAVMGTKCYKTIPVEVAQEVIL